MRKLIIAIMFVAQPALAQVDCAQLSQLAESVMTMRQVGVPIQKVMEKYNEIKIESNADLAAVNIAKRLVITAYSTPKFSTPSMQQEAITEFGSGVYIGCLKASI